MPHIDYIMTVIINIWHMRRQCIPGSFSPPTQKSLGTRLSVSSDVLVVKIVDFDVYLTAAYAIKWLKMHSNNFHKQGK